ncbi:hypothetical protein [Paenibacillus wulumuqiensis]|uniref:hypothetical protein n=1 Tax=Paenibacillus wulumuqiensis TaxID=1567107 RepID=UPI000619677D|nr:hypothetical protein [Paenibacillus wulumuqiensis]
MNLLLPYCQAMAEDVQQVLEQTAPMQHPLIELIRYSLKEQEEALDKLIPLLEADSDLSKLALDEIRPYLSMLYQNNEVSEPTMRAWIRAVHWMPSFETEHTEQVRSRYEHMREQLDDMAAALKQNYGQAAIKYVVPTFYLEVSL